MSTAAAPTANSSASPSIGMHRNVAPNDVGWQFVPQYYTFMNKHPDRLHCFYTKQSTFTHGAEGDDLTSCHGQAEIHAKITSLNLVDCKVFIHSVDAQASFGGGIVIQVIGEMNNNNAEVWRKFVQTFFLAEQPNGYFVLNDVFRYLKEESVDDEGSTADAGETPVPPPGPAAVAVTQDEPAASEPVEPKMPLVEPTPVEIEQPGADAPSAPPVSVPEQASDSAPATVTADWINGETTAPVENGVSHDTPRSPSPAPQPPASVAEPPVAPAAASTSVPAHQHVNGSAPAAATAADAVEPAKPSAPEPERVVPVPPAAAPTPVKPPQPKTWANLAAANSSKWGNTAAATLATSSTAPPPAPRPLSSQQQHTTNQAQPSNRSPAYQTAVSISTPSVFIKGVIDPLSNDLLKSFLISKFGPIKECEVVRNKACAFVDFVNLQDARKAIIASLPASQGGEGGVFYRNEDESTALRITIETRKERADRPLSAGPLRGTGRGGFGHDGGRGGGMDRGSFKGRGRGRGTGPK